MGIVMGTEFADCNRAAPGSLLRGVIGSWRDARTPQGFLVGFVAENSGRVVAAHKINESLDEIVDLGDQVIGRSAGRCPVHGVEELH